MKSTKRHNTRVLLFTLRFTADPQAVESETIEVDNVQKIPSSIIGATGEHYVAAMLSSTGLVVAMPRGGVPSTDLIVTRAVGGRAVSIQVKTGTTSYEKRKRKPEESYYLWDTGFKALNLLNDAHWFAYVYLNGWPTEGNLPKVFFVPSCVVVQCMRKQQEEGQKRPFFWMYENESENYRDLVGCHKIIEYLQEK